MSISNSLKILIVDDEEIVRHTLHEFIDFFGHRADGAEDGLSGMRMLENGDYDAAIVDVRMPGLDGIDFLRRSRKIRPDIPIIMITGHGTEETRQEATEAGAYAFLAKPFGLNELGDLIKQLT